MTDADAGTEIIVMEVPDEYTSNTLRKSTDTLQLRTSTTANTLRSTKDANKPKRGRPPKHPKPAEQQPPSSATADLPPPTLRDSVGDVPVPTEAQIDAIRTGEDISHAKQQIVAFVLDAQNRYGGDNPVSAHSKFVLENMPIESLVPLMEQWKLRMTNMTPIETMKTGIYGIVRSIELVRLIPFVYSVMTNSEPPEVLSQLRYVSVTEPVNIIQNMKTDQEFQQALDDILKKYGSVLAPIMTPEARLALAAARIIGEGILENTRLNAERDGKRIVLPFSDGQKDYVPNDYGIVE